MHRLAIASAYPLQNCAPSTISPRTLPGTLTGNTEPNVVGYGVGILSAVERTITNRSIYAEKRGTSMATPYVSGIAALMASQNPNLTGDILRRHIINNAHAIDEPANRVGTGLVRSI